MHCNGPHDSYLASAGIEIQKVCTNHQIMWMKDSVAYGSQKEDFMNDSNGVEERPGGGLATVRGVPKLGLLPGSGRPERAKIARTGLW